MANDTTGNVSTRVAKVIVDSFESNRVLSKTVNTSLIAGQNGVTNETGDTVYLKRPPQYKAIETTDGDISAATKNSIGVGRVAATVQNFITIPIDYTNLEEVTQLNQLQEILAPAADEACTRLELNIASKMLTGAGLTYGVPTVGASKWSDVSGGAAMMNAVGVPMSGEKYYTVNPFGNSNLSDAQAGLASGPDRLVSNAWEEAQLRKFAGLRVLSNNALNTYQSGATTARTGTLAATPDATWSTHKDTMIQTLELTGLTASVTDAVRPGDIIEFTGTGANARSYVNVSTRKAVFGPTGAKLKWRCTVVTGGDTSVGGAVTVTVTNAAIYGNAGGLDEQFTNISAPLTSGDSFTIMGATDAEYQPNLFYHKNAFALATLKLPKLHATDTIAMTKDGLSMRITKYSDGDKNAQRWRLDMLPVMSIVNPLFMGKGFGLA